MKTMKAMKTKNTTKTKSMNAMKAMTTKKIKKKPSKCIDECDESNDNEEKWIPFVFDNSLEDGPRDERDFLLCMMGEALHKWRTRPKWIRGTCPGYVEEISLVGWMLDSGICLSLRDPPRHDVWDPYEDPPINEDHQMNGDVD